MKRNILLVTYEFPPAMATGGIGSYMFHLANILHHQGYLVSVISATSVPKDDGTLIKRDFGTNYLVHATNHQEFRVKALDLFDNYFDASSIDFIESPEVGACALEIKKKYPFIKLLVKLHTPGVLITKVSNTYQPLSTKLRYVFGSLMRLKWDLGYWSKISIGKETDIEYQFCMMADEIICPSQALKNKMVALWSLDEKQVKVVPNPIILDASLTKGTIERHSKTICFIGKLTILKGMFTLTPAIKELLSEFSEYKFVLVGRDEPLEDGSSMKAWMQHQLTEVADRVQFTGALNREATNQVLMTSDICVVPSLWENYPNVVMEAMAAGCAVAASNRGGIPEIIDPQSGIVFDPEATSSIVQALRSLVLEDQKRINFAKKGRERIEQLAAKNIIATVEYYNSISTHPAVS